MLIALAFAFSSISVLVVFACLAASTIVLSANLVRARRFSSLSPSTSTVSPFEGVLSKSRRSMPSSTSAACLSVWWFAGESRCSSFVARWLYWYDSLLTRESRCSSCLAKLPYWFVKLSTKEYTSASSSPFLTILNLCPQSSFFLSIPFVSCCGCATLILMKFTLVRNEIIVLVAVVFWFCSVQTHLGGMA